MKIYRTFIIGSFALLTSAAAFAGNGNIAYNKEITDFCKAVYQSDKTQDSREFLHFVTTLRPELNTAQGRESLTQIHQLITEAYGGGGSMPDLDPGTIAQIIKLLK